ncbi:MAG: hypothetical protein ABJC13_01565 [Acidobacteriota bacterium]
MKILLFAVLASLSYASSALASSACVGKVPDYVLVGSSGMVLTQEAEQLPCRSGLVRPIWDGKTTPGEIVVIEEMVVPSLALSRAVATAGRLEFRRCLFPDEVYLKGAVVASMRFIECEFLGNFDLRAGTFSGRVEVVNSLFHQNVSIVDAVLDDQMIFSGSVFTGLIEFERTLLSGGLRITGSRLAGRVHAIGLRSPVGLYFEGDRFLSDLEIVELETSGSVRFRDSEWDRSSVISFLGGTIGAGVRFDSCSFDAPWVSAIQEEKPLIRFSDLTVGSSVVIANATSRVFPRLKVSRCVVPFLKLPEWRIAKGMLLDPSSPPIDVRAMEDAGELLQLAKSSYEREGRTRDAIEVNSEHRLLVARIRRGPSLWIWEASRYFGTGIWWFVFIILSFACLFSLKGVGWHLFDRKEHLGERLYRALDLSVKGFFRGPPAEYAGVPLAGPARRALIFEQLLGMAFLFLFAIVKNEWLRI